MQAASASPELPAFLKPIDSTTAVDVHLSSHPYPLQTVRQKDARIRFGRRIRTQWDAKRILGCCMEQIRSRPVIWRQGHLAAGCRRRSGMHPQPGIFLFHTVLFQTNASFGLGTKRAFAAATVIGSSIAAVRSEVGQRGAGRIEPLNEGGLTVIAMEGPLQSRV